MPSSVTVTAAAPQIETGTAESFTTDVANPTGLSFAWDFGDGGTDSTATPQHTYTVAGNYHVTLTVSNGVDSVSGSTDLQSAHYSNVTGLLCSGANSTGWCWENDRVTGHALSEGEFFPKAQPAAAGWVIGKNGTLVNTVDGGNTWNLHVFPALDDLMAESFTSQNNGVVLMRSGVVQRTTDGKNWALAAALPASVPATSIASYDGTRIIVTNATTTETSPDAGVTWVEIDNFDTSFTAGANCWSLGAILQMSASCTTTTPSIVTIPGAPASTQYFAGSSFGQDGTRVVVLGKVPSNAVTSYATSDGGATWTLTPQVFGPNGTIFMADTTHTWYFDASYVAYLSLNGGRTFVAAPLPPAVGASPRAALVDNLDDVFYAWVGGMAVSADFGATYVTFPSPEPATVPTSATSVHVNVWNSHGDGTYDAIVSFDGRYYVAHDAHDGGATWTQVLGPDALGVWANQVPATPPALAFASDAKHGTLAFASGLVKSTADGGRTWTPAVETVVNPHAPVSVAYASTTEAWMTLDGKLWASTDGGATWAVSNPAVAIVNAIQTTWADATHGWTATPDGLFASTDGGGTWSSVTLGAFAVGTDHITSIASESAQVGVVAVLRADGNTHLWRTADGGATWNETGSALTAGPLTHTGTSEFWLGGIAPQHSKDDGQSWQGVALPSLSASLQVIGGLGTTVYAFDNRGHVFVSSDDGTTWPTDLTLSSDVVTGAGFALDTLTVWTVSQYGTVLTTATAAQ